MQSALYAMLSRSPVEVRIMQLSPQNSPIPIVFAFLWHKFNPEILTGSPKRRRQTRVGWGKQAIFSVFRRYLENCARYEQSYYMTKRKLHMRFRLAPRSMILDVLELL